MVTTLHDVEIVPGKNCQHVAIILVLTCQTAPVDPDLSFESFPEVVSLPGRVYSFLCLFYLYRVCLCVMSSKEDSQQTDFFLLNLASVGPLALHLQCQWLILLVHRG